MGHFGIKWPFGQHGFLKSNVSSNMFEAAGHGSSYLLGVWVCVGVEEE